MSGLKIAKITGILEHSCTKPMGKLEDLFIIGGYDEYATYLNAVGLGLDLCTAVLQFLFVSSDQQHTHSLLGKLLRVPQADPVTPTCPFFLASTSSSKCWNFQNTTQFREIH